jgi:hypothetical protein
VVSGFEAAKFDRKTFRVTDRERRFDRFRREDRGGARYDRGVDPDLVSRCRACGTPLEMMHGAGVCLRSGCLLFGQVQEDCCNGAPEPTDEAEVPAGQRAPAPIPWSPKDDGGGS